MEGEEEVAEMEMGGSVTGEEMKDFHSSGPHVGWWITRSVLDERGTVSELSTGKVVGYLGPEESDYLDAVGAPCALWKVEYVSGELEGDAEDLEEWELLASALRETQEQANLAVVALNQATTAGGRLPSGKAGRRAKRKAAKSEAKQKVGGETVVPEESEYERQRRERISANEAFLQQLGLSSKKEREDRMAHGAACAKAARLAVQAIPEGDLRRSSRRCVVDAGERKYDEDHAYREAKASAQREAQLASEKSRQLRLQKEAERKRELASLRASLKDEERARKEAKRRRSSAPPTSSP